MTRPRRWWRPTIRVRLTLLAAAAFFVAGATLVGLMYLFMAQALDRQVTIRIGIAESVDSTPLTGGAGARLLIGDAQEGLRAQFRQDRDATLRALLIASLASLGIVGVAAGGFGWLLAGHALRPLQQITATARRVADRSLHERIALAGPQDEIRDLADTFDAMLERLDHAFESQRRIVANASHELRTPLTINRTLIEVALEDPEASPTLRQLGATLLAVNERHERLIDGLLTLASSERRVTDPTDLDLRVIVEHVVAEMHQEAATAGIALHRDLGAAMVRGDPLLLERLVHNLLDNAIRYNLPQHGRIDVTTETEGDVALLGVHNSGPVVPAYEVPSLFQPFRRLAPLDRLADPTRTSHTRGAGLGLSIVQAIAAAHGGTVEATPRTDGGLAVRVALPRR
jgi:signal transduction histidine kinase